VQYFALHLERNLFSLHEELVDGLYKHGSYETFFVRDPKLRHIHKATVRDRVLHQAVFRSLNYSFDRRFIFDSYSCRVRKGAHAGVRRLNDFVRKTTANGHREAWVLKCDIRKFFDNVQHGILRALLGKGVRDIRTLSLLDQVIGSFDLGGGRGLPLGNVTSQLFANVYLNELDRFVKHELAEPYYLRYCDDFLIVRPEPEYLEVALPRVRDFLHDKLLLDLHPHKVSIQKLQHGTDFLGYIVFTTHTILRTTSKRRALRCVTKNNLMSYLGMCSHASAHGVSIDLRRRAASGPTSSFSTLNHTS